MLVQRREDGKHDDRGARRHRDDAAGVLERRSRVDLGHDEWDVVVITERGGGVDDEAVGRRRERRPLRRHVCGRREDGDVDAGEALTVEGFDLEFVDAEQHPASDRSVGAEETHVVPRVRARREDVDHRLADEPRGADDGEDGPFGLVRSHVPSIGAVTDDEPVRLPG